MLINNVLEDLQLNKVNHIVIVSPKESVQEKRYFATFKMTDCDY